MSKDFTKLALRRQSIRRWKRGIKEDLGIDEPTPDMMKSFLAGFNMGYYSCKTKRLRE